MGLPKQPVIVATGVSGGPFEANGKFAVILISCMMIYGWGRIRMRKLSVLIEEAMKTALDKAKIQKEQVQFLFAGDLINQITPNKLCGSNMLKFHTLVFLGMFYLDGGSGIGFLLINYQGANMC